MLHWLCVPTRVCLLFPLSRSNMAQISAGANRKYFFDILKNVNAINTEEQLVGAVQPNEVWGKLIELAKTQRDVKFFIAFLPVYRRDRESLDHPSLALYKTVDGEQYLEVFGRVFDDAFIFDFVLAHFKLRLDQSDQITFRFEGF